MTRIVLTIVLACILSACGGGEPDCPTFMGPVAASSPVAECTK